jgi:hypothetical protein
MKRNQDTKFPERHLKLCGRLIIKKRAVYVISKSENATGVARSTRACTLQDRDSAMADRINSPSNAKTAIADTVMAETGGGRHSRPKFSKTGLSANLKSRL